MYAETGLLFPRFQDFSPEIHPFEEFYRVEKPDDSLNNLVQASAISEYDLSGENDLFKAPDPIIEEPFLGTDPITSAISMISCEPQELFQGDTIPSEIFYECRKDLLGKAGIADTPVAVFMGAKKTPLVLIEEDGSDDKQRFLDFSGVDLEAVWGIRRAFSEGDIKALRIGNCCPEERREKLLRYRNKKTKRNFGRKIKYACRKALADSQPRIRGRFAKAEEYETSKMQ